MATETQQPDRTNRVIQGIERRFLVSQAHRLGNEIGNLILEGRVEYPGRFTVDVEDGNYCADLNPVLVDHETFVSGAVSFTRERIWRPTVELTAQRFSDRHAGPNYRYNSATKEGIIVQEHLFVIRELRRRVRDAVTNREDILVTHR